LALAFQAAVSRCRMARVGILLLARSSYPEGA
jgi:hypothetical protein